MRLKFFERSENKFVSRIDPRERSERDHKGKFPGACPGIRVQGTDKSSIFDLPWGSYHLIFTVIGLSLDLTGSGP